MDRLGHIQKIIEGILVEIAIEKIQRLRSFIRRLLLLYIACLKAWGKPRIMCRCRVAAWHINLYRRI